MAGLIASVFFCPLDNIQCGLRTILNSHITESSSSYYSLLKVRHLLMEKPSSDESVHPSIADNPKFAPFFNNCIGATDGSLIPAIIPTHKQGPWRDRKGNITQNVLIVPNFDLLYTYALCGWEGSAPDQRVLEDSYNKSFIIPANKFILADAAFTLCSSVLTPYRGVRYHLKEWAKGNRKPANARKLFSLKPLGTKTHWIWSHPVDKK